MDKALATPLHGRLLLADDDAPNRELLCRRLEKQRQSFDQILPSLLDRGALASNVEFRTEGDEPIVLVAPRATAADSSGPGGKPG